MVTINEYDEWVKYLKSTRTLSQGEVDEITKVHDHTALPPEARFEDRPAHYCTAPSAH